MPSLPELQTAFARAVIERDEADVTDWIAPGHGLDAAAQGLLLEFAKSLELDDANDLFLRPEYWDVSRLPESLAAKSAEIDELRAKLFATGE